ncbi:hypothetical protein [Arthrobacter woluwensis]|uniref:hypothetical protein n=1 Tax=Arthrobacter woluwensis TaxID=156980 RepID=UPI0011A658D9|nr:hypothetical protein [Arthrobacter woluwensis]
MNKATDYFPAGVFLLVVAWLAWIGGLVWVAWLAPGLLGAFLILAAIQRAFSVIERLGSK